MGFISNQWLNRARRNRTYRPVPVSIFAGIPGDSWSEEHKITVEIIATKEDTQFQTMHLTRADTEKCAVIIVNACGSRVRAHIALQILSSMPSAGFLIAMTAALRSRLRNVKK